MRAWLQAVTERLEVREGQRGDADERALTQRDLAAFLAESTSPAPSTKGGWWESISNVEDLGEALRNTRMYNDLLRRISNASGEPLVGAMAGEAASAPAAASSSDTPPDALRLVRNDLDFYRLTSATSRVDSSYQELVCTVNTANFFSQGGNHIVFALDCMGEAGSGNPHNAPVIRNGQNLFSLARGFIIFGDGSVQAEQWNGTFNPALEPVTSSVPGFSPATTPIFTVRIVAGYRTGALANHMAITIHRGGGNGQVIFAGSKPWGWDWTGRHVAYFAAIGPDFKSPNETNNVEKLGIGAAPNATVHFSAAKLSIA
ncbi:hypothetical protein LJR074_001981 [Acidovorax sp. LjRoot74]|uniref:hypothetical protein n=1 Tax=Acidovorax sp. LjRoot74 TaxID=3342337 RepID=UPI003ED126E6